jgi:ribosomal protein L29
MAFIEQLRSATEEEIHKVLEEKKQDLMNTLQQLKQGALKETARKGEIKRDIARCMQVLGEKKRAEMMEKYKHSKIVPKDLRPKLPKSKRNAMPEALLKKRSRLQKVRAKLFPKRVVAIAAEEPGK